MDKYKKKIFLEKCNYWFGTGNKYINMLKVTYLFS